MRIVDEKLFLKTGSSNRKKKNDLNLLSWPTFRIFKMANHPHCGFVRLKGECQSALAMPVISRAGRLLIVLVFFNPLTAVAFSHLMHLPYLHNFCQVSMVLLGESCVN